MYSILLMMLVEDIWRQQRVVKYPSLVQLELIIKTA